MFDTEDWSEEAFPELPPNAEQFVQSMVGKEDDKWEAWPPNK